MRESLAYSTISDLLLGQDIVFLLILGLRPPRYFSAFIIKYILYEYRQNNAARTPCPVLILSMN